jgi:hypothetical protein
VPNYWLVDDWTTVPKPTALDRVNTRRLLLHIRNEITNYIAKLGEEEETSIEEIVEKVQYFGSDLLWNLKRRHAMECYTVGRTVIPGSPQKLSFSIWPVAGAEPVTMTLEIRDEN